MGVRIAKMGVDNRVRLTMMEGLFRRMSSLRIATGVLESWSIV